MGQWIGKVCYIYMLSIDIKTVVWYNAAITLFLTIVDLIKMQDIFVMITPFLSYTIYFFSNVLFGIFQPHADIPILVCNHNGVQLTAANFNK